MKLKSRSVTLLMLIFLLLSACSVDSLTEFSSPTRNVGQPILPSATETITDSPTFATPSPTLTASVIPSAHFTDTPTITTTPSATPTPPHPLTIEWLRQQEYNSKEIVIEERLEPGYNYSRYIVSYLSEGLKINALLTVPMGAMPENGWPVIVFNHGYIPPEQYRTTERYVDYVIAFAAHDYIVLRSDYRGHATSEGEARGAYSAPDYTVDVLNAVSAIQNYPDANPDRIGMWGHSMGGYITLRSMVVNPDIKVGVIWAGVVGSYPDLLSRWTRSGSPHPAVVSDQARSWRTAIIDEYGTPEENPEFWASISANSYLQDLSGPLQLHHGSADESVPIVFSQTLYEQILAVGGTVEYYSYKGDNHNISNEFSDAMFRSVVFFDKYLKGD